MINTNRIAPIERLDVLTVYGTMMKLAGTSVTAVSASTPGVFTLTSGSGNVIADEPIKSMDLGASVTSITVYFVAAFDYEGFSLAGTKVATAGVDVVADGATLYTATLSGGTVTLAKAGF